MGTVPAFSATQVVAPTILAGQTLCSVTVTPAAYAVAYVAYYTGTVSSVDQDNIALQSDPITANSFVTADILLQQPITNQPLTINHFLVYAQSAIKLVAVANANAGATYHVQLNAVYPGPSGSFL